MEIAGRKGRRVSLRSVPTVDLYWLYKPHIRIGSFEHPLPYASGMGNCVVVFPVTPVRLSVLVPHRRRLSFGPPPVSLCVPLVFFPLGTDTA